ncbi:MAG: Lrp/AsnC family leucine-responsive transcriptional regulator [Arenicella sp.]|jgi:Lrp/AsnC family leucine-responsive transcriptional regulator
MKIQSNKIDVQDRKILKALQQHCRISAQDLSDKVSMSAATCWRRIKALEKKGVIRGYNAQLDRRALGFEVCAFVNISIESRYSKVVDDIQQALVERPEVLECYATTGESDFTLRVVAKSIEDYDHFLNKFLFELPAIGQVRSSIALREIKQTTILPL